MKSLVLLCCIIFSGLYAGEVEENKYMLEDYIEDDVTPESVAEDKAIEQSDMSTGEKALLYKNKESN